MTERDKKYVQFVENDILHNRGRSVNGCMELRYLLKNPKVNSIFAKHYINDILFYFMQQHIPNFIKVMQTLSRYPNFQL